MNASTASRPGSRRAYSLQPVVYSVTLAVLVGAGLFLVWKGAGFYQLDLEARTEHPHYRSLRPSGFIGHGYGIAGTIVILTNLLYLARRKMPNLQVGSMRAWLDMHVFTGLLGSELVLFHSAFQLRSAIATATAVSLGVVVGTGILGRFLFSLAPKSGREPVREALARLREVAPAAAQMAETALAGAPPPTSVGEATLLGWLTMLPEYRRIARERRSSVSLVIAGSKGFQMLEPGKRRQIETLVRAVGKAAYGEVRSASSGALLRSWRSLHRFFAILMVLAVAVHIAVAWWFGYRWILDQ